MIRLLLSIIFLCSIVLAKNGKLIDLKKCPTGCSADTDCVLHSECRYLDNSQSCGYCVCGDGYKAQGAKCVPIKGYSTPAAATTTTILPIHNEPTESTTIEQTTSFHTDQTESTTTAPPTTTTQSTSTGTTSQGPPPSPEQLNCQDYACNVAPNIETNDNPFTVRSAIVTPGTPPGCKKELIIPARPCKLQGGGACYGIYCLNVASGIDYCICPYYKTDRQCTVDKPGSCESVNGQTPSNYTKADGSRLRNPKDPDNGSVYGRHFAPSLNDCIRLCQWTQGKCRSVNYGTINGAQVCELMSIAATKDRRDLLSSWLQSAPGWSYAQVERSYLL